jgi:hypothetical protein
VKVTKTALKAMIPFLKELDAVKEPSHVIGGHALIRIKSKCKQQAKIMIECVRLYLFVWWNESEK